MVVLNFSLYGGCKTPPALPSASHMDLLCTKHVGEESAVPLSLAIPDLPGRAGTQLLFHAYWEGPLSEHAFISLVSCYYFNVATAGVEGRRIIVWTDDVAASSSGELGRLALRYVEFRQFDLLGEAQSTPMRRNMAASICMCTRNPVYFTDTVRYILLYNYAGVWFDLDTLFLRPFDGLLLAFPRPFVYSYPANLDCPNGAIYYSPSPRHPLMGAAFEYVLRKGIQFDFYQGRLNYDTPMPLLVLPGYWFDAGFFYNAEAFKLTDFFEADAMHGNGSSAPPASALTTFGSFKPGAFAYHWHRPRRAVKAHQTSAYSQLRRELCKQCLCRAPRAAAKSGPTSSTGASVELCRVVRRSRKAHAG